MGYQVIALKYRPQRFEDVVGQEHVTRTLANAIKQNRIAHAYLFCGPRGTGKTTIARIFAKCLNCTDGPKVDFDDDDPRCREIAEGRSLDVLEIDGASNRGIEEIRELRETARYAPATSRFKIYIIDEVHMLTPQAFNALLKTLEEPPEHVKFMFATTEPDKVLPTILSRCQRFDLQRIPIGLIAQHLAKIAKQEKVKIEEAALLAIARSADGCMRDAESALDQLISFCGNKIVEADVLSMFGLAGQSQIQALAGAILEGKADALLSQLNELTRHGKDLGRLLTDLLRHVRDLLVVQVAPENTSLVDIPESERQALSEQAKLVSADALTRILEVLTDAEGRMRAATSKKIFLEVTLLRALQARHAVSLDRVLDQLQTLRQEAAGTAAGSGTASPAAAAQTGGARPQAISSPATARSARSAATAQAPSQPVATAPAALAEEAPRSAAGAAQAGAPGGSRDLTTFWPQLLAAVRRVSPFIHAYLSEAFPVGWDQHTLTIGFDPEFAEKRDLADNSRTHEILRTKLKELGFRGAEVKFVLAERPVGTGAPEAPPSATGVHESGQPIESEPEPVETLQAEPAPETVAETPLAPPQPQKLDMEEFKNDPLIKKALEIFRGHLVEVRP